MRRARRTSLKIVHGLMPVLRPNVPDNVPFRKQAGCTQPLGEYLVATATSPHAFVPEPETIIGRSVLPRSKLRSSPVITLNGRPELTSMIGAKVQSLNTVCTKPLPPTLPLWKTELKTKRWRWSNDEFERSATRL